MTTEKVARLLTDFERPEKARSRVVPFDHVVHFNQKGQPKPAPAAAATPAPLAASRSDDDAYQRGRSEGYASALAEFEQKLDDERRKLDQRLTDERSDLLGGVAAKLAADLDQVANQLETKIAGVVARVLEPLITGAVQRQAVTTFVEQLSTLVTDGRRPAVRITGPAELLDLVRGALSGRALAVEFRTAPDAEVSVVVDDVLLETRLKLWVERLKLATLN